MTVLEGWELSPDRRKKFDQLMIQFDVGDPILISKCKLATRQGLIVVSDNGIFWRLKVTAGLVLKYPHNPWLQMSELKFGNNKWIRWENIHRLIPEKPRKGKIKIEMYRRDREGNIRRKRSGKPVVFRWRATLKRNKGENRKHFKARRRDFYRLLNEIFQRNKPLINS